MNFREHPVRNLYIHIPFCEKICSYCDFCTLACPDISGARSLASSPLVKPYLAALHTEITFVAEAYRRLFPKQFVPLETLYLGGGTPGILACDEIADLLAVCESSFAFADKCEITLELNPNRYQHLDFASLKSLGLNRVSIGLQTSDAALLQLLQREHRAEDALAACQAVRQAGINNVSFDLMLALPGQDMAVLEKDLAFVMAAAPEHVSVYSLILEAGSRLYWQYMHDNGALASLLPDEEQERAQVHFVDTYLREHGYEHYEISNYAKAPAYRGRHNCNVWLGQAYFGCGLNASSYVQGIRRKNTRQIKRYIKIWQEFAALSNVQKERILADLATQAKCLMQPAPAEERVLITPVEQEFRTAPAEQVTEVTASVQTVEALQVTPATVTLQPAPATGTSPSIRAIPQPFSEQEQEQIAAFPFNKIFLTADSVEINDSASAKEDFFAFALRYLPGFGIKEYRDCFGEAVLPAAVTKILDEYVQSGLLVYDSACEKYKLSTRGLDYMDMVSRELIGCLHEEVKQPCN